MVATGVGEAVAVGVADGAAVAVGQGVTEAVFTRVCLRVTADSALGFDLRVDVGAMVGVLEGIRALWESKSTTRSRGSPGGCP